MISAYSIDKCHSYALEIEIALKGEISKQDIVHQYPLNNVTKELIELSNKAIGLRCSIETFQKHYGKSKEMTL